MPQHLEDGPSGGAKPFGRTVLKSVADRPFRVLFICTANICRSPLAQQLFMMALSIDERDAFQATSAGVQAYDGMVMDPSAEAQLRRFGGQPTGFKSSQLTDQACADADLILTATREHRSDVLERSPRALRRTFTVLEFAHASTEALAPLSGAALLDVRSTAVAFPVTVVARAAATRGSNPPGDYDIADPFGRSAENYRDAADIIATAVEAIAARLTRSTID
jgi:protein-tyrosine phosphatase